MVDWTDAQTLWLNLLHALLGGFTLVGLVAMAVILAREVADRFWPSAR
jgi:hypothetical protein